MARKLAELPKGSRISDYISLGVITKTFPAEKIEAVLAAFALPHFGPVTDRGSPEEGHVRP